ncbi:hypothetical protein ACWKSR_12000, partial [Campylobacter fetus subsp. venerealis]
NTHGQSQYIENSVEPVFLQDSPADFKVVFPHFLAIERFQNCKIERFIHVIGSEERTKQSHRDPTKQIAALLRRSQ